MIFLTGILLLVAAPVFGEKTLLAMEDLCKLGGKRIYLNIGAHGVLSNISISGLSANSGNQIDKVCLQCSLELISCPFCIIDLTFNYSSSAGSCCSNSTALGCCDECVNLHEMPFKIISEKRICGCSTSKEDILSHYTSKTGSLSITFLYGIYSKSKFILEYSARENRQFLNGTITENKNLEGNYIISTPFFPAFYPSDFCVEYVVKCKDSPNCSVMLIFTDFQISSSSIVEFFDWNDQRMYLTTGQFFRPPIILSSGPVMILRFTANGKSGLGFRASYSFVSSGSNRTKLPSTDCGGLADNLGGAITMMEIVKENVRMYDCFWIILPQKRYSDWKTDLYLSVTTFSNFGENTELRIHEGTTSIGNPIEVIKQTELNQTYFTERKHIAPIEKGFYISLKGAFRPESKLAIVYSAFSSKDCFAGANFLCHNRRCISIVLHCDGFDNCGDNSDEPVSCFTNRDRFHHSMVPNFYFPTVNHYYDFKSAAFVFVICSVGMTCLIFGIVILLYRINLQNQNRRRFQDNMATINAILEEGSIRDVEEEEIIICDDPPDYEDPPKYTDVMANIKKKNATGNIDKLNIAISNNPRSCCSTSTANLSQCASFSTDNADKSSSLTRNSPPPAYTEINNARSIGKICEIEKEFLRNSQNTNKISRWLNVDEISSPLTGDAGKRSINKRFSTYERSSLQLTFSYSDSDLNSISKSASFIFEIKNNRLDVIKLRRSMSSEKFFYTL